MRESEVVQFARGRSIALESTQGGITAVYRYDIEPLEGGSRITLDVTCEATGFWKLLHPVIVRAMKKSDSSHLRRLGETLEKGSRLAGADSANRSRIERIQPIVETRIDRGDI